MAAYYKKIGGKDYDRALLDAADSSVKGKGDGRISLKDAKKILAIVSDAGSYSPTEKRTIQYIRDKYSFTAEADTWFRTQVRSWAAKRGAKKAVGKKTTVKKTAAKRTGRAAASSKPAHKAAVQKEAPAPMPYREQPREEDRYQSSSDDKKSGGLWKKILLLVLIILTVGLIILYFKYCPQVKTDNAKDDAKSLAGDTQLKQSGNGSADQASKTDDEAKDASGDSGAGKEKATDDANTYTVLEKDSLISISEKITGDYQNWEKIYTANKDSVKDPRVIFVGQKLKLPEGLPKK